MPFFTVCSEGFYKSNISNERCMQCPHGSKSNGPKTMCDCRLGKYRLKNETGVSSAECYGKIFH